MNHFVLFDLIRARMTNPTESTMASQKIIETTANIPQPSPLDKVG